MDTLLLFTNTKNMNEIKERGSAQNPDNSDQDTGVVENPKIYKEDNEDQIIEDEIDKMGGNIVEIAQPLTEDEADDPQSTEKAAEVPPDEVEQAELKFATEVPDEEVNANIRELHNGIIEFANSQAEDNPEVDPTRLEQMKKFLSAAHTELKGAAERISQLVDQSLIKEATELLDTTMSNIKSKAKQYFGNKTDSMFDDYEKQMMQAIGAKNDPKRKKYLRLAADAVDFIPVAGSAKMITEAFAGKTLSGRKLRPLARTIHLVSGTAFLALDLTGIGGTLGKSVKAPKLLKRSAALMRKLGGDKAGPISRVVYKTGVYLAKHKTAEKIANKSLQKMADSKAKIGLHVAAAVSKNVLQDLERENERKVAA